MPIIGTFSAVKDGYNGRIRTLTMNVPVRLFPNDRKDTDGAPDFRIMSGMIEVGVAWRRTRRGTDDTYLSVKLDCPALPQPIWGALFEATDDAPAQLVWRRDRRDDG